LDSVVRPFTIFCAQNDAGSLVTFILEKGDEIYNVIHPSLLGNNII